MRNKGAVELEGMLLSEHAIVVRLYLTATLNVETINCHAIHKTIRVISHAMWCKLCQLSIKGTAY